MAASTRHLLAGMFLSLLITVGVSTTARLLKGESASANGNVQLACVN